MVIWAGRIMIIQGLVHMLSTAVINTGHVSGWLSGELWLPEGGMSQLTPSAGGFWLGPGSFGIPLLLLGALVVRMGRAGEVPPAYVAWTYGIWGVACAAILEPTPFVTTVIPFVMLLVAARRAARSDRPRELTPVG